jgi:tetratricopeptide (TPR) repeat protein
MTSVDAAATVAEEKETSIEEMEDGVKANPNDSELKKDLAYALLFRYLYGAEAGDKQDLKRLRALVKELPEPMAQFPRAYISYLDKKYDETVKWLIVHASTSANAGETLTCDELYAEFLCPFSEVKAAFWTKLSEGINHIFPNSAASYCLQAIASAGDTDAQASCYQQALDTDSTYWFAAWELGDIYKREKNWQSALTFYEKALQCESQRDFSDLHFACAWCLSKLKRYEDEEKQIRAGLKLDPEYEFARNNLGWLLYKQGKYQEALAIFEELIKVGADGKYPLHNRARCLKALKRYDEAIDAWRAVNPNAKLPAWITTEIFNIQKLINAKDNMEAIREHLSAQQGKVDPVENAMAIEDDHPPADEEEDGAIAPEGNLVQDDQTQGKKARTPGERTAAPKESMLEETIEKLIVEGRSVFDRKLKIYNSPEGYGRQFIVRGHGRIDLLTEDTESGELVVIELKKDESHDIVVGQISLYMSWVRENLAKGKNVVGLICVFSATSKLKLAAKNIPGLELFEYDLAFSKV